MSIAILASFYSGFTQTADVSLLNYIVMPLSFLIPTMAMVVVITLFIYCAEK